MTPLGTVDSGFSVTPSDSTPFAGGKIRALYVGGTGDVSAVIGGASLVFKAVPVGTWLWIGATQINSTGTTATLMLGLY